MTTGLSLPLTRRKPLHPRLRPHQSHKTDKHSRPVRPSYRFGSHGCLGGWSPVLWSTIHLASSLGSRGRFPRPSGFFTGFFFFSAIVLIISTGRWWRPLLKAVLMTKSRLCGRALCLVQLHSQIHDVIRLFHFVVVGQDTNVEASLWGNLKIRMPQPQDLTRI